MGSARTTPGMRGPTSRRGGEPVALAVADVAAAPAGQLALGLGTEPARTVLEPRPGVVLVPDWLDVVAQRALVADFREWARPPAGLRRPRVPAGHLMTVQAVCLGWHWYPYAYSRTADDTDGAPVKPLPPRLLAIARDAVATAYGADSPEARAFAPDAAIVNLYPDGAKLGLHQDGEEPSDAPVVTLSLGDTCTFRFADVDRRVGPFLDLELRSGDLLVFGREQRRVFHGVPKVFPGTAPEGLGLPAGRLSITVRETGFS
ncbi:MAG TPA: alpha-ketoglutarate-dependent dioxygenase AlkB [Acidimicrobiia bacterium]|jgi:alkylated DNA repair protein (DNA oxidative demethylase)|nr:alpha-ketoglutarate-dependent dioxygenase AlkB [Acidimicrobiia bacterium]